MILNYYITYMNFAISNEISGVAQPISVMTRLIYRCNAVTGVAHVHKQHVTRDDYSYYMKGQVELLGSRLKSNTHADASVY